MSYEKELALEISEKGSSNSLSMNEQAPREKVQFSVTVPCSQVRCFDRNMPQTESAIRCLGRRCFSVVCHHDIVVVPFSVLFESMAWMS